MLEARDVMKVLRNDADAPADLRERALLLAGLILDFDPGLQGGDGLRRAEAPLASGAALAHMETMIEGQGRARAEYPLGHLMREIPAPMEGARGRSTAIAFPASRASPALRLIRALAWTFSRKSATASRKGNHSIESMPAFRPTSNSQPTTRSAGTVTPSPRLPGERHGAGSDSVFPDSGKRSRKPEHGSA